MSQLEDHTLSIDDLLETGRMREQLEIARRIQQGLLPSAPPGLQGFELDGWNEPCFETGGDYYDFLRLPAGRVGLAVGDVSSHGIGPALLMAGARAALRALFPVARGPGDLMSRLNDVLVDDMLEEHFMTMFVAVLDLRTRELRYALAGHERPRLLRNGRPEFERLESKGMPLGIQPGMAYPEGRPVRLRPGDLVACPTDGIWEATAESGEEFGYGRLEEVLRKHRDRPAHEIIDAVRWNVFKFIGKAQQHDDITLLVLKAL
jgi:sigma-B regulation protein RsbU (phosphoserine phosphatase)